MKHDVGAYVVAHQNDPKALSAGQACGGQVAFSIQKVKITVTVTADDAINSSGGLKVPLNLLTVEATTGFGRTHSDTVTTTLSLYPQEVAADAVVDKGDVETASNRLTAVPASPSTFTGTPIADALGSLRKDLLATAKTPPCFDFGKSTDQKDNTVKWAFTVTDKISGTGKFGIQLFSVGADGSNSRSYANTIEVTYIGSGEGFG